VNYSFFVTRGQIFDNISRGLNEIGVGANNEPNFLNIPLSATFPIVFGSSRQWQFSISADAEIFGVSPNEIAVADLGDTALWGGVSSVRDAEGNLIASFSVTSASGTDWSQAASEPSSSVPEGPSLALSALGIIALLATRRRR
jgi:MYXO-CTERM domain-containing protein